MSKTLISLGECEQIVSKLLGDESPDSKVIDYDVSSYSDGYPGFLGDYFSLVIRFNYKETAREEKFFLKSLPTRNLEKRDLLEKTGICRKEAGIFGRFMPKLFKYSARKFAPTCYLSRDDLIVFEDLKPSYQTLPQHIDLAINHIKMALRSLSAFHAASIIYEHLELRPKGRSVGDEHKAEIFETSYTIDNPWCMTGIRALKAVALHKTKYGFGSSYESAIERKFMDRVCEIFDLLESNDLSIPRVCCHRDLWKNNLMYRFDDGNFHKPLDCLLIDFQICRYLPLTLDVTICILLPSRDHSNFDECLKFYFEQLKHDLLRHDLNLDEIMTWRDYETSCKGFKLFPLVQQGIFWTLSHLPEAYLIDLLENNEAEYIKICLEQRDSVVLEFMEKDEFYCTTMTESVERLIQHLFDDGGEC